MISREDSVASAEMIERLAEAAESRAMIDPPRSFVPDTAGGDPIPWEDNQRGGLGDAAEHRRY